MSDKDMAVIVKLLKEIDEEFWGVIVVRIKAGKPVVLEKSQTFQVGDGKN